MAARGAAGRAKSTAELLGIEGDAAGTYFRALAGLIKPREDGDALAAFQCRLNRRRRAELETRLREVIKNGEDHVLLIDIGPADRIDLAVESIGKSFSKVDRQAVVI